MSLSPYEKVVICPIIKKIFTQSSYAPFPFYKFYLVLIIFQDYVANKFTQSFYFILSLDEVYKKEHMIQILKVYVEFQVFQRDMQIC